MKFAKSALASLLALGVVTTPVAAQAEQVRAPSEVSQSEELAGASFVLYLALAAAAAALVFFVLDDDGFDTDDLPASP